MGFRFSIKEALLLGMAVLLASILGDTQQVSAKRLLNPGLIFTERAPSFRLKSLPTLENGKPYDSWLDVAMFENLMIDVPATATRLTVTLTNDSGDLDLLVKFGSPVTGSSYSELVDDADFVADGYTEDETIEVTLNSTPPLQQGQWYIAVVNINDYYTTYTVTATYVVSEVSALENGKPLNGSLDGRTFRNDYIDVPDGATKLTVTLTNGAGNLDLYLKFGSKVSGATVGELNEDADFMSVQVGADERIEITPQSNPPLQVGRWYIAVLNLNNATTSYTLTATYEEGDTASFSRKPQVAFLANEPFIMPWMRFRIICQHEGLSTSKPGDLYVVLADPDSGALFFLQEGQPATVSPVPFKTNITAEQGELVIMDLTLPETLPLMDFTFYCALLKHGVPVVDSSLLSDIAVQHVVLTNISRDQSALLSEKGNPAVYSIRFDHTMARRQETWLYSRRETYLFENGTLISIPPKGIPLDAASADLTSAVVGPDLFYPTMTTRNLLDRLGEPDHIIPTDAPNGVRWFYDEIHLSVYFVNNRVSDVEVD